MDRLAPTTQLCSNCGQQYDLALRDRILTCDCGLTLDRDTYGQRSYHNAAINIKHAGASTDYLRGVRRGFACALVWTIEASDFRWRSMSHL